MNAGFAIWRNPGENPAGIRGDFQVAHLTDLTLQDGFILKPWEENSSCFYLDGVTVTDMDILKSWVDSVKPCDKISPSVMSRLEWADYIRNIQQEILLGHLQKVVAARQIICATKVSLYQSFTEACKHYPDAFVSIVQHPQYGIWLGATPEILVQPNGQEWETVSMAGTLLDDSAGWTGKEIEENTATQHFLELMLDKIGAQIIESGQADAVRAGTLRHLVRRYRFSLSSDKINQLIGQLHPTPAVGGFPRQKALSIIAHYEQHTRGLFAGFLGFYRMGKPHVWVNLRCCEWCGDHAILHAGAGINALSHADAEWEETSAKMNTIGSCL